LAVRRRARSARFELIPMIDVMMILTLILALMAFMPQAPHALETELPNAKTGTDLPQNLTVELTKEGIIHVKGKTVTVGQLGAALAPEMAKTPDMTVILAADKRVAYEQVMLVLDTLKQNGVARLSLAVGQADGKAMP
jgi:biopolymer transport protein TolR